MSPLLITLCIALAIVVVGIAFRHWRVRRHWKLKRAQVRRVLDAEAADLARKHPVELRDILRTLREVQCVQAAYRDRPEIRECDRASTGIHLSEAEAAIGKIREAMEVSVKERVDHGLVVPAMPGAAATSGQGGSHEAA